MSDTVKTILWIVLALIVIALLIRWFMRSAARRRELETRRLDTASLRAPAQESTPSAPSSLERASSAGVSAVPSQPVVDTQPPVVDTQPPVVDTQTEVDAQTEVGGLGTDEGGDEFEASPAPVASSVTDAPPAAVGAGAAAGAVGSGAVGSAAFAIEEDEPDLADADDPFADADTHTDAEVGDASHPEVDGGGLPVAQGAQQAESADDLDWVNGPIEDSETVELDEAQVRADPQAADWINEPAADESPGSEEGSVNASLGEEQTPQPVIADTPEGREVSRFDEVRDGGYGPGSAAPIADGARPLDHPVKAWRDTMTYVLPGGAGYDGTAPDVWFFDEAAARRAGFRSGRG
ncbi:MAG: hypothetical protein L0H25_09905 [Micrococcales bacterium]|nr:hypothetical protein [Micrococcales bacterium]